MYHIRVSSHIKFTLVKKSHDFRWTKPMMKIRFGNLEINKELYKWNGWAAPQNEELGHSWTISSTPRWILTWEWLYVGFFWIFHIELWTMTVLIGFEVERPVVNDLISLVKSSHFLCLLFKCSSSTLCALFTNNANHACIKALYDNIVHIRIDLCIRTRICTLW